MTEGERQDRIEELADTLIDREDYFDLSDPTDFLEWGAENMDDFRDPHSGGCYANALFDT